MFLTAVQTAHLAPQSYFEQPMPTESAAKSSQPTVEKLTTAQLERLANEAEALIFNNFDVARQHFEKIETHLSKNSPAAIRVRCLAGLAFLENQENRFEEAVALQLRAVSILEKSGSEAALADALLDLTSFFSNIPDFQNAEKSLRRAAALLDKSAPPALRARLATREGFLKLQLGQPREALEFFLAAEQLFESLGAAATRKDFYLNSLVFSALGELYNRSGEREKSIGSYLQALSIAENHDLRTRLAALYLNCGRALLGNDNALAAQFYFENALKNAAPNDLHLRSNVLSNLGIVAYLVDDNDRALRLFNEGLDLFDSPADTQDFDNLSKNELWQARIFDEKNNPVLAELHFEKALHWAERAAEPQQLLNVCESLADFHARHGQFREAFELQQRATRLVVQLADDKTRRDIREIETRHELEKRRQEAREAKLRLTGLQLRALRAQMNPHFLFNALNAIQGQITSGRTDDAERHLARFAKLMRRTLDYSDWEVVSLETEIAFLENYLDLNQNLRFAGKMTCRIFVEDDLEADDLEIPTMIVQPFVENAIEHGLRPMQGGDLTVNFSLTEDENMVLCVIEDNGEGYHRSRERKLTDPSFSVHKSRGMEITRERLDLLHGEQGRSNGLWVQIFDLSEMSGGQRRGTRVEVLIPIL